MYADNIHHITTVHECAGKWVAQNLPEEARVAAFDIGVFGYYADRYIIDLGGLLKPGERVNPEAVLNGIAFDPEAKRLFVTGKLWPKRFEIRVVPKG